MTNMIALKNPSVSTGNNYVQLLGAEFSYAWSNQVVAKPGNTFFGNVYTQFSGWNNPAFSLTFYIPIDSASLQTSSYMTWSKWNEFVKAQYLDTSATQTKLKILLGVSDYQFTSYAASSLLSDSKNEIPVQILSYNVSVAPDSSNGGTWIISAQLQETK